MDDDANARTLASYEQAAERYRQQESSVPAPTMMAFLDRVIDAVPPGASTLEIGSGPGRDASLLEARGLRVRRTDATAAFVSMMRRDGHPADLLDVRTDDLGGPYDLVYASAVLLHLTTDEIEPVLRRLRGALRADGVLAFTVKEGVGAGWSTERLDVPRWFTYWQEPDLREVLGRCGWAVLSLERGATPIATWLAVLAEIDSDAAC